MFDLFFLSWKITAAGHVFTIFDAWWVTTTLYFWHANCNRVILHTISLYRWLFEFNRNILSIDYRSILKSFWGWKLDYLSFGLLYESTIDHSTYRQKSIVANKHILSHLHLSISITDHQWSSAIILTKWPKMGRVFLGGFGIFSLMADRIRASAFAVAITVKPSRTSRCPGVFQSEQDDGKRFNSLIMSFDAG